MSKPVCEVCGSYQGTAHLDYCPLRPSPLKWKRAEHCWQEAHGGGYWVERSPDGGHFNRWHAHRRDIDEQLTFDGFATRAAAKAFCEQDHQEGWAGEAS